LEQGTVFVDKRRVVFDGIELAREQTMVDIPAWGCVIDFSVAETARQLVIKSREGSEMSIPLASQK